MTLDQSRSPDQRHGEPGILALTFEIARTVAPTMLRLLYLWLERRRSRPSDEGLTDEVTLPCRESLTSDLDPSDSGSSTSAEETPPKGTEKLAAAAAKEIGRNKQHARRRPK